MMLTAIRQALADVGVENLRLSTDSKNANRFLNLDDYRACVYRVHQLPGIDTYADAVISGPIFRQFGDVVEFDPSLANMAKNQSGTLFLAAELLLAVLDSSLPRPDENSIRIRLPDSTDYRTSVRDQEQLVKALEQLILHPAIGGELRVKGWESGSLWVILCVGGTIVVALVAAAVWAAAVIRKKMVEGDLLRAQVEALGVQNQFIAELSQKAKEAAETALQAEASAIHRKFFAGEDSHEEVARIKLTIKELADLIHRGAQVQPALIQPESSSNLFPNFEALNSIVSKIPELEDSSSGS